MGSFDKCCCCLSKRTSAIVCTLIMLFWYFYTVFNSLRNVFETNDVILDMAGFNRGYLIAELVINSIAFITVFLLLIGILKDNVPLMKQFNIIYLVYLIVSVANEAYFSIKFHRFMNNLTAEDLNKYNEAIGNNSVVYSSDYPDSFNFNQTATITMDRFKEVVDDLFTYLLLIIVIGIIVDIVYYITTRNYTKSVEEGEKEIEDIKNMESAN